MRRPSTLLILPLLCGLVAAGCENSTPRSKNGADAYVKNGTFNMAVGSDLGTFDPYQNRLVLGLSAFAYDSLVNSRPDGTFVSGLAEKWVATARSATFTLRRDVTCSDGTPLTASQVAADLNYVKDPKNSVAQYGTNAPTVAYSARGDDTARTVKVTMKSGFGFLLNTLGQVPIVCAGGMKDRSLLRNSSSGTGPYVLTRVVPGQSYTFTARKGYKWGPGGAPGDVPGAPATVVLRVVTNETTAANLLLSGELNFAKVSGADQERLRARGLAKVGWKLAGAWLAFNEIGTDRPTTDRNVRQALVNALDVVQVLKVSTGGLGSAPTGLVSMEPNPCPGNTIAGQLPKYDLAAADSALNQAGWIAGKSGIRTKNGKPLTINLHYVSTFSTYEQATAELIAQQWRKIGAQVTMVADTLVSAGEVVHKTHNYDVFITEYNFGLPSQLVPYLSGAIPPDGDNIAGIHNKSYEEWVAKAVTVTVPDACPHWQEAERAIVRNVDLAPLSNRTDLWFLQKARARIQRYNAPIPSSIRVLR